MGSILSLLATGNENIEKRIGDPAEMSISRHCSVTWSHFFPLISHFTFHLWVSFKKKIKKKLSEHK